MGQKLLKSGKKVIFSIYLIAFLLLAIVKIATNAHFMNPGLFGTSLPNFSQIGKKMMILAN